VVEQWDGRLDEAANAVGKRLAIEASVKAATPQNARAVHVIAAIERVDRVPVRTCVLMTMSFFDEQSCLGAVQATFAVNHELLHDLDRLISLSLVSLFAHGVDV